MQKPKSISRRRPTRLLSSEASAAPRLIRPRIAALAMPAMPAIVSARRQASGCSRMMALTTSMVVKPISVPVTSALILPVVALRGRAFELARFVLEARDDLVENARHVVLQIPLGEMRTNLAEVGDVADVIARPRLILVAVVQREPALRE